MRQLREVIDCGLARSRRFRRNDPPPSGRSASRSWELSTFGCGFQARFDRCVVNQSMSKFTFAESSHKRAIVQTDEDIPPIP